MWQNRQNRLTPAILFQMSDNGLSHGKLQFIIPPLAAAGSWSLEKRLHSFMPFLNKHWQVGMFTTSLTTDTYRNYIGCSYTYGRWVSKSGWIWLMEMHLIIYYGSFFPTPASVVTYQQLKTMLSNHDVQLFDVRNPDEFQAGRIADAVNIPCKWLHSLWFFTKCIFEPPCIWSVLTFLTDFLHFLFGPLKICFTVASLKLLKIFSLNKYNYFKAFHCTSAFFVCIFLSVSGHSGGEAEADPVPVSAGV